MTTKDKQLDFREKIIKGLEKVYEKLIIEKKEKKSKLVIMKGNKIVKINP
ncbi:hypothetical protein JL193_07275 [Polaribacter batillariae]|uniref:Uncharacterized protein n=1 Tax=Polaribacter batillariae TaxID=2808900 RepID=A0ABX7SYT1_9FLAO|nr:hypothetical protein [Polaribacter batillariae]QTD39042.1 hypothetical protein JL193_07275 [Polaribacter batillariae]